MVPPKLHSPQAMPLHSPLTEANRRHLFSRRCSGGACGGFGQGALQHRPSGGSPSLWCVPFRFFSVNAFDPYSIEQISRFVNSFPVKKHHPRKIPQAVNLPL